MLDLLLAQAEGGAVSGTIGGIMGGTLLGAIVLWLTRVKLPGDDASNAALRDRLFLQLNNSEAAREKSQERFLQALAEAERKCADERRELRSEINAKDEANRHALAQLKELITHDVSVTKESARAASDLAQASERLAGAVTSATTRRRDSESGIHGSAAGG